MVLARSAGMVLVVGAFALLAVCPPAWAGGARSFVSGGGLDSGTCERTAPCRTFAYAIGQTNAGGEVVAVDSSGYGAVTITKAIAIVAPRGVHAGISPSSGTAITVNAGSSDDVTLRNLSLRSNGATTGVDYQAGGSLAIDDSTIANFSGTGVRVAVGPDATSQLIVSDTALRRNATAVFPEPGNAFHGPGPRRDRPLELHARRRRTRASRNRAGAHATATDTVAARNTGTGFVVAPGIEPRL